MLNGHGTLTVEPPAFAVNRGELFHDLVLFTLEFAAFPRNPVNHLGRAFDGVTLFDLFRTRLPQSLGKILPTNSTALVFRVEA